VFDCAGTPNGDAVEDCNGNCEGLAYIDQCGDCVDGNTNKIPCQRDCAGFWGGDLIGQGVYECVGVGDEENDPSDNNDENECDAAGSFWLQVGNDFCDVCGGDDSSCEDDCGEPNGDNTSCADCNGVANGPAVLDADDACCLSGELDLCGVCDGPGKIYECGCTGLPIDNDPTSRTFGNQSCSCDGTIIEDDCGACGGNNYFMRINTDLMLTGENCDKGDGWDDSLPVDQRQNCVLADTEPPQSPLQNFSTEYYCGGPVSAKTQFCL
jgi:hypothetical protein